MRRHRHDSAGAIAHEDVVGDVNGNLFIVDWINRMRAGEDAGFFFGVGLAVALTLAGGVPYFVGYRNSAWVKFE